MNAFNIIYLHYNKSKYQHIRPYLFNTHGMHSIVSAVSNAEIFTRFHDGIKNVQSKFTEVTKVCLDDITRKLTDMGWVSQD